MRRTEGRTAEGVAWTELGPADAPPLVACHGMALDHSDLQGQLEPFADRFRIVMWDMPGHGASGRLPDPCTLRAMTDALEAVLQGALASNPILLGFSFGGMVIQEALRRGVNARAFVAMGCHAPFSVDAPLPPDVVESALVAPILAAPWPEVRAAFAAACSKGPDVQARLAQPIDRLGAAGLAAMTRALFTAFEPDPSFQLVVPTMVLRGADDANGDALVRSARALLAAGDDVREVVVPDAGHCLHLDQPKATRHAIATFLDRLGP